MRVIFISGILGTIFFTASIEGEVLKEGDRSILDWECKQNNGTLKLDPLRYGDYNCIENK